MIVAGTQRDEAGRTTAVKLGVDSSARWFAVGAVQGIYAQEIPNARGCVYVQVYGQSVGTVVACRDTMREAQALADEYAAWLWGTTPPTPRPAVERPDPTRITSGPGA